MSRGSNVGYRVCSCIGCPLHPGIGCPEIHPGTGKCPDCRALADATRTSGAAKYGTAHRTRFRPQVLAKNGGLCVGLDEPCGRPATVADHHPLDRDELVRRGLDPDDPRYGRPLCKRHHDVHTARTKPAGFRG